MVLAVFPRPNTVQLELAVLCSLFCYCLMYLSILCLLPLLLPCLFIVSRHPQLLVPRHSWLACAGSTLETTGRIQGKKCVCLEHLKHHNDTDPPIFFTSASVVFFLCCLPKYRQLFEAFQPVSLRKAVRGDVLAVPSRLICVIRAANPSSVQVAVLHPSAV